MTNYETLNQQFSEEKNNTPWQVPKEKCDIKQSFYMGAV